MKNIDLSNVNQTNAIRFLVHNTDVQPEDLMKRYDLDRQQAEEFIDLYGTTKGDWDSYGEYLSEKESS